MLRPGIVALLAAFVLSVSPALADSVIDFESLGDFTPVTNQFADVVFANATAVSAGVSLNDAEFPPHSGVSVAFDDGGPISLSFLSPLLSFDGFFTYNTLLTLEAFDETNAALPVVTSSFGSNYGSSGNPPNDELSVSFAGGISRLVITGDPNGGGSFVVDDITLTFAPATEQPSGVPEPASFVLLGAAVAFSLFVSRSARMVRASRTSR